MKDLRPNRFGDKDWVDLWDNLDIPHFYELFEDLWDDFQPARVHHSLTAAIHGIEDGTRF